uniref:ATP-binding cassette sub-family G member 3-like n=1 Tax=Myodes glareolus TaxID=447135 RepID=UPI002020AF45|nr:ATP-binding cassette sub-family G member 3-like [Myodes glareolus]
MSSNNDSVAVSVTGGNSSDLPGNSNDPHTLTEEAVLSFHNISYQETVQHGFPFCKKPHVVERLSNISGIMKPGLNAIIGPQEGCRSLLLDVLAARKDPRGLSGDILINGEPRPANFTCTSGYVPQNDVVMRTVTVRDNIEFSAALRLPMTMTRDEKRRRINYVLELLHLDKESNVKPRSKELRKRTSIAMELVTEHPILFLDDPTTGLELRTTADVILILKRMSKRGQTIIFSINQPHYSIFKLFDSLTLVASGKVMFHGPAQEALSYFSSSDLHSEVFFMNIIAGGFFALLDTEEDDHEANEHNKLSERQQQLTEKLANKYIQSSIYSEMRTELDPLLGEQKTGRSSALEKITFVTPFWYQLWWIICRSFKNFKGFPRITVIWTIITVLLAVIVGTTFRVLRNDCTEVQTRASLIFSVTILQCVISVTAGEVLVIDRDRFPHEHTSGYYRVSSYFLGKLLGDLVPRRLLPSIIFTIIVFSIAGVNTDVKGFFTMIFTIMMLASSASSLPLSIGAGQIAMAVPAVIVTIYFVFMLFISGLYSINITQGLSWIKYLSIPHYGFTALLHNEFLGQNFCPENKTAEISRCHNYVICTGEEFLAIQDIDFSSWGFWENHVALACIMIILLSITYVELSVFSKKKLVLNQSSIFFELNWL